MTNTILEQPPKKGRPDLFEKFLKDNSNNMQLIADTVNNVIRRNAINATLRNLTNKSSFQGMVSDLANVLHNEDNIVTGQFVSSCHQPAFALLLNTVEASAGYINRQVEFNPITQKGMDKFVYSDEYLADNNIVIPPLSNGMNLVLPYKTQPEDWNAPFDTDGLCVMKSKEKDYHKRLFEESENGKLDPLYSLLNQHQSVGWRINKFIFAVYEAGRSQGIWLPHAYNQATGTGAKKAKGAITNYQRHQGILDMGDTLYDEEEFFFKWNSDKRGRIYPLNSLYLSPQGNKVSKAMLEFSKPVVIETEEELKALCTHLAACFGCEPDDPIQWAINLRRLIEGNASSPLVNKQWHTAKSPAQYLAACHALCCYWEDNNAEIRLPVEIDGVANAFQHLAGVTRDESLARRTQLIQCDDIDVHQMMCDETANNTAASLETLDDSVKPFMVQTALKIHRDLFKHVTLAKCYGSEEDRREYQLNEALGNKQFVDGIDNKELAKHLLAPYTKAFNDNLGHAFAFTDWVKECAKIIVLHNPHKPLYWRASNGVLFCQFNQKYSTEYKKYERHVEGKRHSITLSYRFNFQRDQAKAARSIQANIVHHLDGLMLAYVSNLAVKAGIEFTSIHDCYVSNVKDIAKLQLAAGVAYHDTYENDIVGDLYNTFMDNMDDDKRNLIPAPNFTIGNFKIEEALGNKKFFR